MSAKNFTKKAAEGAAPPELRPAFSAGYVDARKKQIRNGRIDETGHFRSEFPGYLPLSFSALWKYRECPRQFKLAVEQDLRMAGDAADRGTELHSVAESVQTGAEHVESGTLPLTDTGKYFEIKRKLLEAGATEGAKTEVELFMEWEVEPGLRVQFRSFVDWLLLDAEKLFFDFEDYKTGRGIKYDEHEYQRFCYALSIVRNYVEYWHGRGRTTYLQFQKPHGGKVQEFTEGQLEEFAVALEAQVRALANDTEFKPKPDLKRCGLCDFAHKCDAAQQLLTPWRLDDRITLPAALESHEDAVRLAAALFHLDAMRDRATKLLKGYAEKNDKAVELPELGGSFRHWTTMTKKIRDIDGLLATAKELGIPYEEVVQFNTAQAKSHIEHHPELQAMASEVESGYQRFEFRLDKKPKKENAA